MNTSARSAGRVPGLCGSTGYTDPYNLDSFPALPMRRISGPQAGRTAGLKKARTSLFHGGDVLAEPLLGDFRELAVLGHLAEGFLDLLLQGVVRLAEADDVILNGQGSHLAVFHR